MAHSDNQTSKETQNRTDGKSEGLRKNARVVDMSWAADYLDDTWENEHAAKGAYDTQVLPPLKKYMQPDTAGVNPLSSTQEFKAVPGDDEPDDLHIVDAVTDRTIATKEEVLKVREAVSRTRQDEPGNGAQEEEDELKIRDAVTDQTVASVKEARAVRRAAAFFDLREDLDERPPIRDALSGSSFGSGSDPSGSDGMAKVRQALASAPKMPAFLSRQSGSPGFQTSGSATSYSSPQTVTDGDIRTAGMETSVKTPAPEISQGTSRLYTPEQESPVQAERKEEQDRQEEQEKTIVASKEVRDVREAASGTDASRFRLEEMFREDEFDPEPDEDDLYDQYEDIEDYDDPDDYDDYHDVEDYDDYHDVDDYDDSDDPGAYEETDRFYEPDDDYDRREKSRKRPDKYYYGYKQPRNPLRFIPLVLVVAICVLGFIVAMQICHDVPLNASDYSKVKYTVESGLTDEQLSEDLQALGIIDNPLVFRLRCKFYSADYVPGTYELSPCYSTEKIINILSGYTYGTDD